MDSRDQRESGKSASKIDGKQPVTVRVDRVLGRGTFSTVYRAQVARRADNGQSHSEYVALKVLRLRRSDRNDEKAKCNQETAKFGGRVDAEHRDCVNEIVNLKKLDHPNIVRLLWWDYVPAEDDGAALLKIATELATGGDLRRMVREHYAAGALIAEATVWSCTVQLCAALKHMHDAGIMHRDIKPANIFVYNVYDCCDDDDDGDIDCHGEQDNRSLHLRWARATLKLGDFGFSKGFRSCNGAVDGPNGFGLRSVLGSPLYMSPERLLLVDGCSGEIDHEHLGTYYADSDIWSAACCVYELAALQAPFHLKGSLDMNLMMNRVTNGFYPPIPCDMYSPQMAEFIDACMAVNRRLRPTGSSALRRARAGLVESLRRRQRPARSRSPRVKGSSPRTGQLAVPSRSTTLSSPQKGGLLAVPSRTTTRTSVRTVLQDVPPRTISIQVPSIQQINKSGPCQRPAVERLTVPQWSRRQATTAVVGENGNPSTLPVVLK
ncbi:serine/threonine-protein kinase Nek7-like [Adelges cooleyi]|uniref:serine/threonine-protein kinase Nek7-like n=1 Tax=Adelges cooleyi TaxID=133065 RepID=UPI00218058F1|nr:serine/threonine-protein kinase Nek7-like [Adelges cooleyi]